MFYKPAEWVCDKIIYLAWPFDEALWQKDLLAAQLEFIALVKAMPEQKIVLFSSHKLPVDFGEQISVKNIAYADIWLRDTLPIFIKNDQHTLAYIPRFNGWGNKYLFKDDIDLASRVADRFGFKKILSKLCFEGGAIECDGDGLLITTEQCLLNNNRNTNISKKDFAFEFEKYLGAKKIIWLKEGLLNDHTDGHVDNLARFLSVGKIAIMTPRSKSDPNYRTLMAIKKELENFELVELPAPLAVLNNAGQIMPASYLNFIITKSSLLMPTYGSPYDDEAKEILAQHSDKKVIGLSAKAILSGGGTFHCMSQDVFI